MSNFPESMKRPVVPNGCRRAPWHDYRSRSIYMITINASEKSPVFSIIKGIPGDHIWPAVAEKTEIGKIIASNLSSLKSRFPFVKILRSVIMPDHIHFVIFIESRTEIHLGEIISYLKQNCTRQYKETLSKKLSRTDIEMIPLFEDGYHDRILLKSNQLQKMLNYVSDNPRRRLLRMMNPDFHRRGRIKMSGGREFEVYGNVNLLLDPDIEPVKVSSKYTPEELRMRKICWVRTVENCGVLVSPFISRDERKVYDWAVDNGGRIIYIIDNGLGERYAPKGMMHDLCSEGRLLVVGSGQYSLKKTELTRAKCEAMNELAVEIAEGKFQIK